MLGNAARPASALLPPDHWAGDPDLGNYQYDVAQARALLAARGYDAQHPLHIVYKTSSDPFRIRLATVIQQQLAQAGIDVELQTFDWGTFYGDVKAGRFQMFSLSWVGVKTPDIFRYAFHSESLPPAGANRGRYRDTVVDQLIDTADRAGDEAQQARGYRAVQQRLFETLPYVPLWYEDHVFVARRDVEGYSMTLDGNFDGLMTVTRRAAAGSQP
jgi:peptide/nickel transport system substrate-binding protein